MCRRKREGLTSAAGLGALLSRPGYIQEGVRAIAMAGTKSLNGIPAQGTSLVGVRKNHKSCRSVFWHT